jgi:hypothetical protein
MVQYGYAKTGHLIERPPHEGGFSSLWAYDLAKDCNNMKDRAFIRRERVITWFRWIGLVSHFIFWISTSVIAIGVAMVLISKRDEIWVVSVPYFWFWGNFYLHTWMLAILMTKALEKYLDREGTFDPYIDRFKCWLRRMYIQSRFHYGG